MQRNKTFWLTALVLLLTLAGCHRKQAEITFEVHQLIESPCADDTTYTVTDVDFDLSLTLLQSPSRRLPIAELNRQLQQLALGCSDSDGDVAMRHFCDSLRAQHHSSLSEMDTSDMLYAETHRWNISVKLYPELLEDNLLTYAEQGQGYLGGVHGYTYNHFYAFNLRTAQRLTEDDLFNLTPAVRQQLDTLLRHQFIDSYATVHLKSDSILRDSAMIESALIQQQQQCDDLLQHVDFTALHPNGNFRICEQSLIYHFDAYEIAPYAYGSFDVEIPSYKLHDLLNPEGLLFRYWF